MEESQRKEPSAASEPGAEEDMNKLSETHPDVKHQKNKKKKEDKEIEELTRKVEEKEKEVKQQHDRLLMVAADLENFKKRGAREKEDWIKFANEDLMKSILPFIDNLTRAVNHAEKAADTGVMIEGVRLILQQLLQTLSKFGLSPFESVGKPFDPAMHEAMLVVETDQYEPNLVVEEFQKGYFLYDRLLRPATVSVSKSQQKEIQVS